MWLADLSKRQVSLGIQFLKMISLYRLFTGSLQHHYGIAWNFPEKDLAFSTFGLFLFYVSFV